MRKFHHWAPPWWPTGNHRLKLKWSTLNWLHRQHQQHHQHQELSGYKWHSWVLPMHVDPTVQSHEQSACASLRAKLKSNLFSHFRKDRLPCNAKSWTLIWEKCWAGESFDNLSTLQFCSFQKIFKEVRGGDNLRSWKEEMEQKWKLQCTG